MLYEDLTVEMCVVAPPPPHSCILLLPIKHLDRFGIWVLTMHRVYSHLRRVLRASPLQHLLMVVAGSIRTNMIVPRARRDLGSSPPEKVKMPVLCR